MAHLTLDLSSGTRSIKPPSVETHRIVDIHGFGGTGVYLEDAGSWVQTSELTIDTVPGSWGNGTRPLSVTRRDGAIDRLWLIDWHVVGVVFKGAGTWVQNGTATISTTQNGGTYSTGPCRHLPSLP